VKIPHARWGPEAEAQFMGKNGVGFTQGAWSAHFLGPKARFSPQTVWAPETGKLAWTLLMKNSAKKF
jgi:hypothetical protein